MIFKVPLGTPSVKLKWDFPIADEPKIDDFQLQRTGFDLGVVPSGPYTVMIATIPKTAREYICQIPTGVVAGRIAYCVIVSRKAGSANSVPSNTVGLEIIAPPAPLAPPTNVRI